MHQSNVGTIVYHRLTGESLYILEEEGDNLLLRQGRQTRDGLAYDSIRLTWGEVETLEEKIETDLAKGRKIARAQWELQKVVDEIQKTPPKPQLVKRPSPDATA